MLLVQCSQPKPLQNYPPNILGWFVSERPKRLARPTCITTVYKNVLDISRVCIVLYNGLISATLRLWRVFYVRVGKKPHSIQPSSSRNASWTFMLLMISRTWVVEVLSPLWSNCWVVEEHVGSQVIKSDIMLKHNIHHSLTTGHPGLAHYDHNIVNFSFHAVNGTRSQLSLTCFIMCSVQLHGSTMEIPIWIETVRPLWSPDKTG